MGRPRGSKNRADINVDVEVPLRNSVSGDELREYINRIENINEEQKTLSSDRSQIYKELKQGGYSRDTVREIVRRRKMTHEQLQEAAATLDMYLSALGDFADTPLGLAGADRMQEDGRAA